MKRKKLISFLILFLFGIWFFQYFLSYFPGAYTIGVFLIGISLWLILLGIAIYQIIKLTLEKPKHKERQIYTALIIVLNFTSLTKPLGIVDWEKYEEENILVAEMVGTVNCQTIIKLKNNNRFKYISRCFGVDFYFGTYKIKKDTIYFELQENVGFMDKYSYATLIKTVEDTTSYRQMNLYKNYEDKRNISFFIKEIKMDKLNNEKVANR